MYLAIPLEYPEKTHSPASSRRNNQTGELEPPGLLDSHTALHYFQWGRRHPGRRTGGHTPGKDLLVAAVDFVPSGRHRMVIGGNEEVEGPLGCRLGCCFPPHPSFNCISKCPKKKCYGAKWVLGTSSLLWVCNPLVRLQTTTHFTSYLTLRSLVVSCFRWDLWPSVVNTYLISNYWSRNRRVVNSTFE